MLLDVFAISSPLGLLILTKAIKLLTIVHSLSVTFSHIIATLYWSTLVILLVESQIIF